MILKPSPVIIAMFSFAAFVSSAAAQVPQGSTGQCKDGSYSSASSNRGACAGHGGVKDWYESKKPAVEADAPAAAVRPAPERAPAKSAAKPSDMPATAAVGGGPGKCGLTPPRRYITAVPTSGTARPRRVNICRRRRPRPRAITRTTERRAVNAGDFEAQVNVAAAHGHSQHGGCWSVKATTTFGLRHRSSLRYR